MVRLRIDLAYDGAPFRGYARQPGHPTVQGVLEDALRRLVGDEDLVVVCAGRTDAGVHAEAQVVHLDVSDTWPRLQNLPGVRRALDGMVGPPITVRRVRRVPADFSARFDAVRRRYRYRLWDREVMLPLLQHDTFQVAALDVESMHRAGQAVVGTHDYTSFCRRRLVLRPDGNKVEATLVRRIDALSVRRSRPAGLVLVRVDGKAFCHNMVRAIVGSLIEVGHDRKPEAWIGELLAARDRTGAGPVAPARGLSLVGVSY